MKGDRIKLLRKAIGLTQEQLAQKLGIGKAALSMIETGKAGDIVMLDSDTHYVLPYYTGMNSVKMTIKAGKIVSAQN